MAGIGSLFGEGSAASQFLLYGVAFTLGNALLAPVVEEVREEMLRRDPIMPITPAQLADMVVRNFVTPEAGATEAALSGVNAERFGLMVDDAGEPPGPIDLATLLTRGQIAYEGTGAAATTYQQGVAEGRLKNKWAGAVLDLAVDWPTPADVLQAFIRSQLTEGDARALFKQVRGNPDFFTLLYETRGNPVSPGELITLARRKVIPWDGTGPDRLTVQQGVAEGDTKNKWYPAVKALGVYVPPPRTVTALERSGAIDQAQAAQLYQDNGLAPDLAAAYAKAGTAEKLAGTRQLAEGAIATLYETRAITNAEAATYLGHLGYAADEAALVLELGDLQRELRVLNSAVTRVGTLYVAHKITRDAAGKALAAYGVVGDHQAHLLATWDTERVANVRQLTPAQIVDAWEYGNLDDGEASGELVAIGYTPFDAWVLLSNKAKKPLPGKPAQGPPGPGLLP